MIPVSTFAFDLPPELIAQEPRPRGGARLLVVDRRTATWREAIVRDLPSLLAPGDLMIGNDTRVFPARLLGRREPSGGAAECFLLERVGRAEWRALVHPGQKLGPRERLVFVDPVRARGVRLTAEVLERYSFGQRLIRLEAEGSLDVDAAVDVLGHMPLPPYIRRPDRPDDRHRYQTVYAEARGSVAAPTAGLHFDDELIAALRVAGVQWETITLHVGYGTFKPVRVDQVEDHRVDAEHYDVSPAVAVAIQDARARGRRVVAVGTTTTRALESAGASGQVVAGRARTDLFIYPGYRFTAVDALLTNFHLPQSSLLMLVAAFAGVELTMAAYRHAVASRFQFYSYGDAMLIV